MADEPLTDREIEKGIGELEALERWRISPNTPYLLRALRELKGLRARRCVNCDHYAYYDGPLCGLNDVTKMGFLFPRDPDIWYCADWEPRRD